MRHIVDAVTMKAVDDYSIKQAGIPSVVLMERAALCVTAHIIKDLQADKKSRVLCICGSGNNGADGLAVARQLSERGISVEVLLASDKEGTKEYALQKNIIENLGIKCVSETCFSEYNVIVDAIFGNGLSRDLQGRSLELVKCINTAGNNVKVIAVDIPTGVDASTGKIMGDAVCADITVTFGYEKIGMMLYPGSGCCGKVVVEDIGFAPYSYGLGDIFTYDESDLSRYPARKHDGHKGTFGRALVVAGSLAYGGAAILAGMAVYKMGAGLVKVMTHVRNGTVLLNCMPECILQLYGDSNPVSEMLGDAMQWSDCMCIGPGLSMCDDSAEMVRKAADAENMRRVFDADALNIIARDHLKIRAPKMDTNAIVTPHVTEMSRLLGVTVEEVKEDLIRAAKRYAIDNGCICVLKDARTVVSDGIRTYINSSGNNGMATGGSGDVLTGIITGLLTVGMPVYDAACLGVYIHGLAGDAAARQYGTISMTAMDIVEHIYCVMQLQGI